MAMCKNPRSQIFILHILFLIIFSHCTALDESKGFTLKISPWDSPNSPLYQPNLTHSQKIQKMAISSKARSNVNYTIIPYSSAVQVPLSPQNLYYSVKVKIGRPGKEVLLLLDTGSGPIWTHCSTQSKVTFNPKKSKTYKVFSCDHPMCRKENDCECIKGQCVCNIWYGVSSDHMAHINTVLSSESFALPRKNYGFVTFPNMIFGCSDKSTIFSGILGMNKLPVSFISQVRNQVQGRFSYCLHGGDSYLRFGNDIPKVERDVKTINLLLPHHPTLFLDLMDISVGKKRLGLSPDQFVPEKGGFLIDTGAPFTVLKRDVYDKVIHAIASYYSGRLKQVSGKMYHLELDLCYKYDSSMLKSLASMTFHFHGADYVTNNLYVWPKNHEVVCVGLIPGEISILGALQQWNTRFIFDLNSNKLNFVNEDCSRDGR